MARMNRRILGVRVAGFAVVLLLFAMPSSFGQVEPALDTDGDGLLTLKDVYWHMSSPPRLPDEVPEHPCGPRWFGPGYVDWYLAGFAHLEMLRRSVPDPLPHWVPFWPTQNDDPDPREVLRREEDVSIVVLDSRSSPNDPEEATVRFFLDTFVPIKAFSILLDSPEKILRVPSQAGSEFHLLKDWYWTFASSREERPFSMDDALTTSDSELDVVVRHNAYLITNGRYVVQYGIDKRLDSLITPGSYLVEIRVRLPRGTRAGDYVIAALDSSQVVLETDEAVLPTIAETGTLTVSQDVNTGSDGGVPPFQFGDDEQTMRGSVEFRVTDAEAAPGASVTMTLQMRTDVPLNTLFLQTYWDDSSGALSCADGPLASVRNVFIDPRTGRPYPAITVDGQERQDCADGVLFGLPYFMANFGFRGGGAFFADGPTSEYTYPDRIVEHFEPLGEWVDVVEVDFNVSECAAPGDVVTFTPREFVPGERFRPRPYPSFIPYDIDFPCDSELSSGVPNWRYDYVLHAGELRIVGDRGNCEELPPLGISYALADATARPGDIARIPIFAATEEPTSRLRLALETDPELLNVDAVEIDVVEDLTGQSLIQTTARGELQAIRNCPNGPNTCTYSVPWQTNFFDTDAGTAVIDQFVSPEDRIITDYPGPDLREIGRLVVSIPRSAPVGRSGTHAKIRFGSAEVFGAEAFTGGFRLAPDLGVFDAATSLTEATIFIEGDGFLRGDATGDGSLDLADALGPLNYLFLNGSQLQCEDGADLDDNGSIEIVDALLLLNYLFLNGVNPASPFPACGSDATEDGLGCGSARCR